MQNNPLYKKAVFQAARRAMLENEIVVRKFVEEEVPKTYTDEKLERLNEMLLKIFDNDLFDVLMGQKEPSYFEGMYDQEILTEIAEYAANIRKDVMQMKKLLQK